MARDDYETDLKSAIESVKAGNMGLNEAARFYSISSSTLSLRLKGGLSRKEARVGIYRLSAAEEAAIIKHVEQMDAQGIPLTRAMVRDVANDLVTAKESRPVGNSLALSVHQENARCAYVSFEQSTIKEPFVRTLRNYHGGSANSLI